MAVRLAKEGGGMGRLIAFCVLAACGSSAAAAVDPNAVFIVVNANEPKSRELAEHYCKLRTVPTGNIIPLDLPVREEISRADYDAKLLVPLRTALEPHRFRVQVVLTTFGIPLRVGPQASTDAELKELAGCQADLEVKRKAAEVAKRVVDGVEQEIKNLNLPMPNESLEKQKKELAELQKLVRELEDRERQLKHSESEAAVDSELMQIWWPDYPKSRWVANPWHWQFPADLRRRFPPTVMTCRIDGPTVEIAKRIVTDAIWVEEQGGLRGRGYFDARGFKYDATADPTGTGPGGYDESMREAAKLLEQFAKIPTTLDNFDFVFDPGMCPDCALYCGWYSVRKYVPAFKFNRGAVAWHLASFEMLSLKNPDTQWCGNLLRDGACVTLGPVAEPYTVAFPKPAEFFGLLATGEFPLVECYARTLPISSWMMCLVGDPLYNPYKAVKPIKANQLFVSPRGSRFFISP
jgi:uncharacterized protein (TIGR03790 family)